MIAVAVNEWRNGQYIGYVIREFNTNVITGMNSLPSITNSTLNFNICAPSDTIQVNLFSIDPTDSITTSVISFPPNSNYVTLRDISTFFTEHTNYLNDTNILELGIGFTTPSENIIAYINVEDNQCPIKGIQSYAIVVTASNCSGPCSITIPLDTITACQTLAQLSANPSGGQPPYTFSWSPATGLSNPNIANPTVSQAHNQNYIVTLTDALGCTSQDSVIVNAYNPVFDTLDICSPDSVLLDFGPGASNYFWQFFTDTLGNTTSLTNTTQTLMATQPGDYMGYAVFSGCGALTSVINVRDTCAPPPCITFDIVTTPPSCPTCNDGTASIINLIGGCPPYAFSWSSGQITQNITGLSSGSYDATVIDGGCCPGELVTCCLACDSVWPGDANSDLIANVYDILPIGVFYSTTETVRPGATSNWNAEWSAGWSTNQGSGANIKHVDCDGDGTIDFNDVNPILLNYNLTHVARWEENSAEGINDPDLYIDIALDTVPTSTPLAIPINFGTAALTADSIYGIAMSITYDASLIDSIAGITVDFSASWLGTEGLDMITLDTNFYDNGKIDIGLVRTDGQMMSGFGNIFTLNIITIDNLSGKGLTYETLAFDFFNVVIIDNVEGLKLFNQQMDSVVIESMTTGINKIKTVNNVHIVPNPNNGNFKIYISDIANSTIEIYNTMGQLVNFNSNKQRGYLKIDMSSFEKGMYFVKVLNKNKAITIKKVIVH
ncbi:MAG: T9SS type A sorting domain-containing protein [Flavobacteriales bacterium]|nr:T9SS type A sorting domain-containing protein [Flavobacteriales bacterium]